MDPLEREEKLLHSVALQNASSILRARQRAEEELIATKEALRESNERVTNILESITDGLIVVDRAWRFTYLNPKAEELLGPIGLTRATARGTYFWDAFPGLQGTSVAQDYRRAMDEQVTVELEVFYPPLDSWYEVRAYPSPDVLSVYFQDITRRKAAEASLAAEKRVLELIATGVPQADVLDALARETDAQSMDGMHCSVLVLDPDGERLLHGAAPSLPQAYNDAIHGVRIGPNRGSCGTAAFERREVVVSDIDSDPLWADFRQLAADHGLRACTSSPILSSQGQLLGTLAVYYTKPGMPSDRDLQLVAVAKHLAGIVIERNRGEEELRRSAQFNLTIIESSRDCFKTLSLDGTLLWMSQAGQRVLCVDDITKLIGTSWIDFWGADERDAARAAVEIAAAGDTGKFVGYYPVKGEDRWWNVALTPILGTDGRPERLLAVSRDITERVVAEQERKLLLESEQFARAAAERASQMKDEFLATLSHELRTPLSSILGWAQMLRLPNRGEAEMRKGLDTIERNARMQTQLIEDLLDMSRITSGKVRLDVQPVEPFTFVDAAVETVRPAAEAKGIRLEKLLDPAAGPVSGDPGRLQQVVWNLLSNAIKFTPKDGKVQVVLERVNSHIEISVGDTGSGIEPSFLAHVFERFRQADASTTRVHGGLGLGLAIVKHLVELHGGTVRAHSAGAGQGSTFTVHLPVAAVHRSVLDPSRQHPRTATPAAAVEFKALDLTGVKVLVVDDQDDARDLVCRVLADCNAQVLSARSAVEALEMVERERPDVLVSDIGMPGVDGFELLRRVRLLGDRGGKVPAIALTAFARSEDRTRALRAGFLVHVSKPVEPAELIATVATVAGRAG